MFDLNRSMTTAYVCVDHLLRGGSRFFTRGGTGGGLVPNKRGDRGMTNSIHRGGGGRQTSRDKKEKILILHSILDIFRCHFEKLNNLVV